MATISPLTIKEDSTTIFTISDNNNASNIFYSFQIGTGNKYGDIINSNGLLKTFTFRADSGISYGIGISVDQNISYDIYDDYPILSNLIATNNITFKIFNVGKVDSGFGEI